jgi:hypothetical protein
MLEKRARSHHHIVTARYEVFREVRGGVVGRAGSPTPPAPRPPTPSPTEAASVSPEVVATSTAADPVSTVPQNACETGATVVRPNATESFYMHVVLGGVNMVLGILCILRTLPTTSRLRFNTHALSA